MDCLFCKIVAGDIPARKLYEDDDVIAFHDIAPQAPVHFLVIPKKHIPTLHDLSEEDDKPLAGPKNDPMMPLAWTRSYTGSSICPHRWSPRGRTSAGWGCITSS